MAHPYAPLFFGSGGGAVTVGGIFVGIGVSRTQAKEGVWSNAWFDFGMSMIVIGVALALIGAVLHVRHAGPNPMAPTADVTVRASALSAEIYEFLAERHRDEPVHEFPPSHLSEDAKHLHFQHQSQRGIQHSTDTMSRYQIRFSARALAVFDEATRAGVVDGSERWDFEVPTNSLGIAQVARTLGSIGQANV